MQPKVAALLWDMVDHGEYILSRTATMTIADYESNRDARLAIERAFHNIGEAARRLNILEPEVADRITELRSIIGFRNVLAHNYDQIDNTRVWGAIETHLPLLIREARQLLTDAP